MSDDIHDPDGKDIVLADHKVGMFGLRLVAQPGQRQIERAARILHDLWWRPGSRHEGCTTHKSSRPMVVTEVVHRAFPKPSEQPQWLLWKDTHLA